MIFGTMDRMGSVLIEQTAEIAGRIAGSGDGNTSPIHAAKQARKVMAELLGLKSLSFELTQTAGVVNGIEISFELKDAPARPGTTCGTPAGFELDAHQHSRKMASVADGEVK